MGRDKLPWNKLTRSAEKAVADLVVLLAGGFTGRIEIDATDGGISEFRELRRRQAGDLGELRAEREME